MTHDFTSFSTEFYSYLDDGRLIKKGTSSSPLNGAFEEACYLTCSTNWQPHNVVFFSEYHCRNWVVTCKMKMHGKF